MFIKKKKKSFQQNDFVNVNKVKSTGGQWIILRDHADTTVTILVYNPPDE